MKRDGKITLEPRHKKPDSFQSKVKSGESLSFRVNVNDMIMALVSIKVDLRLREEVEMEIKRRSLVDQERYPSVRHIAIPFTICLSTTNDKPCPFKNDYFKRF